MSIMGDDLMQFLQVEPMLKKSTAYLRGVTGDELKVKREMKLFVEYLGEKHLTRFIVVAGGYELLSGKDARRLGILKV